MTKSPEEFGTALSGAMNRHGFAFQEAASRAVVVLGSNRKIDWFLAATEFPVSLGTSESHVDLVLEDRFERAFLAVECKRVDPAVGYWHFARSRFEDQNMSTPKVVLEELHADPELGTISNPLQLGWSTPPFNIAVEGRTQSKGDGVGGANDAIAKSVAQALRGAAGLAQFLASRNEPMSRQRSLRVVPVVVTTATLVTSENDLGSAPLDSGRIDSAGVTAGPVSWLWYNHNRSRSLRPDIPSRADPGSMAHWLSLVSTRSVAIVNAASWEEFLRVRFS
ncbi:hypothetical protein Strain138_002839 [Pseudogemmatithrix spongiicola]|uniref:Uncharacterized protein n=1 Tax=Pseudogemmatithrix spongiicola TaxID=3062599 RepID=A0AA49Q843_9BACT|nr:hypothetical protein Strain138_002839 [Gemmatimonadaceae bacterium 'strain 138']WKW16423.1 hypothetical protein Strain318_002839 [Gemmatimonadaceae bacterium 'strain 318']